MRAVADTSFLVALVDFQDFHAAKARKTVEEGGPPAICDVTLAELMQVTRFKASKLRGEAAGHRESREAMRNLLDHLGCTVEAFHDPFAARALFEKHRKLSWPDAVALAFARGRELWTFDEEQARLHKA